ncbi:MAG: DUF1385 domain-containing protein [Acidobacteriota bacterium]
MSASPANPDLPNAEILVGGQALLEGVMMRTPGGYGVAVRRPDGSLALERGTVIPLGRRFPALKLPLLRGVAVLGQSLAIGLRALNFSAAVLTEEPAAPAAAPQSAAPQPRRGAGWLGALSTTLAIALGLGIFLFLPLWLTELAEAHGLGPMSSLVFNLCEGTLRAVFFLAYLLLIARLPDIHRVFMYHGAEHKVVFAQEAGGPLTVEGARRQSRLHPRCGTSFLLFVLLLSIFVFALVPRSLPLPAKFAGRLLLLPVLAGLSYEILRWTARRARSPLFRVLVWPGLQLQRITTQEPSDDMLEVAIAALQESWSAERDAAAPALAPAAAAG